MPGKARLSVRREGKSESSSNRVDILKPSDKPDKDGYFDEPVAARYDESSAFAPEIVDPTVDFLANLAADGPALEFGIGTGRIAIPLAERGVLVHGIDLSGAMTERLHAKPGGERIDVEIGDFASTTVEGSFALDCDSRLITPAERTMIASKQHSNITHFDHAASR